MPRGRVATEARSAAEVDWFILAVPTGVFEVWLILNGVTLIDQKTTQAGNPKRRAPHNERRSADPGRVGDVLVMAHI